VQALFRFKNERCGVDAVAEAAWFRAVGKNMTQMATAIVAVNFGSGHSMTHIDCLANDLRISRFEETGPAGTRVKFCITGKERFTATSTLVGSFVFPVPIFISKRWLGALFS